MYTPRLHAANQVHPPHFHLSCTHTSAHPACLPFLYYLQQRYHYYGRREEAKNMQLPSCDALTRRFRSKQAAGNTR